MTTAGDKVDGRELLRALRDGLSGRADLDVRVLLGLAPGADDRAVSRELVAQVARDDLARLGQAQPSEQPVVRESHPMVPVDTGDISFLGRLKPEAEHEGDQSVAAMDDVTTLLSVLRAGSLRQRRAAARRIAERVRRQELLTEEERQIEDTLDQLRDAEVAYELSLCRSTLPSGRTREALRVRRELSEMAAHVERAVKAYWEGEAQEEPLIQLSGDARAQLLMHARELSDDVMAHVAAMIEGNPTVADRVVHRILLSAVRYAGDPRLVPSLIMLLDEGDSEVVIEAARAVSRVDDPRVWPALAAAYDRSVIDIERIALGAALGRVGDVRSADYVRAQLRSKDEHVLIRAIEALRTLGTPEDVPDVLPMVHSSDTVIATKALHTLGRIADGRCLSELSRLLRQTQVGAVRAAAEEARVQIRARLVLRGEEPPSADALTVIEETRLEVEPTVAAFGVRLRALRHYLAGRLWQLVGARARAVAHFEDAGKCRPDWSLPMVVGGMMYASRHEYAQALGWFRRALDAERTRVERNPLLIRHVAHCYLRRSEQVERDGRLAIARGLLDEVMSLDLRRAPSSLRFEIGRRHETLRSLGTG